MESLISSRSQSNDHVKPPEIITFEMNEYVSFVMEQNAQLSSSIQYMKQESILLRNKLESSICVNMRDNVERLHQESGESNPSNDSFFSNIREQLEGDVAHLRDVVGVQSSQHQQLLSSCDKLKSEYEKSLSSMIAQENEITRLKSRMNEFQEQHRISEGIRCGQRLQIERLEQELLERKETVDAKIALSLSEKSFVDRNERTEAEAAVKGALEDLQGSVQAISQAMATMEMLETLVDDLLTRKNSD